MENDGIKSIPVKGMRKIIAARMMKSLQNSAQLTHMMQADITELMERRAQRNSVSQDKISVTDILIKVVGGVLVSYPHMNGWMSAESITLHKAVHMGVAVSLDGGLIVPVIRNADQKSAVEISAELKDLSARARTGKLKPAECSDSTFTISNLGMYRLRYFTPIINEPEIAILGVGGVFDSPEWRDDTWQRRRMLPLSLTFNHGAVDGAPAAEFLQAICEALEQVNVESL